MADDDLLDFLDDIIQNNNKKSNNSINKENEYKNEYINTEQLTQTMENLENKILYKLE